MSKIHPSLDPFDTGMLDVGDGHRIHYAISGNPDGVPIVFNHGGPGSGFGPWARRLFNPETYRIVQYDQRGAGKSTPHASETLEHNTTPHLIADMEKLRIHLGIEAWHVGGYSWGCTLSLAYADAYPERVHSIVVQGTYLATQSEIDHLYKQGGGGCERLKDIHTKFLAFLPEKDRSDPITGYGKIFSGPEGEHRDNAVKLWTELELTGTRYNMPENYIAENMADPKYVWAHSLLENYYWQHEGFIDAAAILSTLGQKLTAKPVHIVHGQHDWICPLDTAHKLHAAIPQSTLHIVENAGHSTVECGDVLVDVFDELI